MKIKAYLSSKAYALFFIALAALITAVTLIVCDMGIKLALFAASGILLLTGAGLTIGFLLQKKRIDELNRLISQLNEKYLLGEMLPEPKNAAEAYYFEVMRTLSRSCIGEVSRATKEKDEYCEYVESWIHEIKTPLTACSLILENGGDTAKLRRELKRADNLTACILYYARMKNPENDTLIRSFKVSEIIDSAIKEQMSLLIAARTKVETDGGFTVASDAKALSFILGQLLVNSAKYCPGCKITVSAHDGKIVYTDNGEGIPSYELPRITEKGFTGEAGRKNGSSTGMGLYIVSELCRHLNIDLQIESETGKYTRFTLSFTSLTKV